jgi:2'-5' RNA ligase
VIRAFVALTLPDEVAGALVAAQAGMPAGRPVERENLHLTLAFLGEHPEPVVEDVHYALDAIRLPAFELRLAGMDLDSGARPRALFAEAVAEPRLGPLRDKVAQAARGAGVRLERARYRPHVTLARFNAGLTADEAERMRAFAARGAGLRAGPFEVTEFRLVRSHLGRTGPVYDALALYPLTGGGAGRSVLS